MVCLASMAALAWVLSGSPQLTVHTVACAWGTAAVVSSAIGLLQYFGLSPQFQPWINTTAAGEAFANLRQRNQFATLTNIGLATLLWCAATDRSTLGNRWRRVTVWLALAAAVLAAGNVASSSRTGVLQLLLLACLAVLWGGWRRAASRVVLVTAAVSFVLATFLLPWLAGLDPTTTGLVARMGDVGPSCLSRLVLWRNVLELVAQRPWLGWGWGELDYAHFITQYSGPRFCDILDNAHNLPLHLAVELGLPVALLGCGLALVLLARAAPWREKDAARQLAWTVLALVVLHSLLEYPLWYGPFQIAVGLGVWILWPRSAAPGTACAAADNPSNSRLLPIPGTARTRGAMRAASALLLAGLVYAAWDYHRVSQIYLAVELRAPAYREATLDKVRQSWLFRNQARFAEMSTSVVTPSNAATMHALASDLLHFSPESRVVEILVNSALLLGRRDEADFLITRYRLAFPKDYARWAKAPPPAWDMGRSGAGPGHAPPP